MTCSNKLLVFTMALILMFSLTGPAWAATTYDFISREYWIPPETSAVELGSLVIKVDPLLEGEHKALFALPDRYQLELPGLVVTSTENANVALACEVVGDREFVGTIENNEGSGKYTFIVPIKSTIPSGVKGDIELTVTPLVGQLPDGVVVVGAALPGEVTLESSGVGKIKDGKSMVRVTLSENMAGLLSRGSKVKLTLPEGFGWANAKGTLVSGEDYRANVVTDGRTLEVRTERASTRRATFRVEAEVLLVDATKAKDGEVRAAISGLDRVSPSTILVAHYQAPEPEPKPEPKPEPTPKPVIPRIAVFTIGSANYTTNGVRAAMDVAPYLKTGRTYLPLRYVGYSLGAEVAWDGPARRAVLTKDGTVVQVTIGHRTMFVNGAPLEMDAVAELVPPGRIMLPYRFIAEAFAAGVTWNPAAHTVTMTL